MGEVDVCSAPLTSLCGLCSPRASSECRPAGADPAERRLQRSKGQVTAAQVVGAAGHPLRHLSNCGLRQRQPDWEDAHPAAGGGEGERCQPFAFPIVACV